MSMTTLVILQFVGIFAAYTGLTVLLPAVMFRRVLRGRRLSEQFLMCYTFGNFYIINIVFAVQLLHISNFQTLVLLTVVLSVLIWSRVNRISLRKLIIKNAEACRKLLQGSMGIKGALYRVWQKFIRMLKYVISFFYCEVVCNTLQWILAGAIAAALFWVYGRQLILTYGYRASDIPVHLNWINQMSRGNLFVSGVYPFGFHCVVYYLHTVFRVDTYVILCLFYLVQVFFYSCGSSCNAENVVQIFVFSVCRSTCIYTWKLLGKADIFAFWCFIAPGIRYDLCNPVYIFSDPVFSDRKRKFEDKRDKTDTWVFCHCVFVDISYSFLRNYDCGTLLHRNCCWICFSLLE